MKTVCYGFELFNEMHDNVGHYLFKELALDREDDFPQRYFGLTRVGGKIAGNRFALFEEDKFAGIDVATIKILGIMRYDCTKKPQSGYRWPMS